MPMFDCQTMTIHVKHILVNERMYTHPLLAVDAEERKMQQNALLFIFKKIMFQFRVVFSARVKKHGDMFPQKQIPPP